MKRHLIGIGGVGMSALATALVRLGDTVTGADRTRETPNVRFLESLGIRVFPDDGSGVDGTTDEVVVSTAIEATNPGLLRAQALGIPVTHRAKALARALSGFRLVAVVGTCGKSTVTAMLGHVLAECGLDPFCVNGANVPGWDGAVRPGKGAFAVAEVDESDKSLVAFSPSAAIVTNASADHYSKEEMDAVFDAFVRDCPGPVIDGREGDAGEVETSMPGAHNRRNAALALRMAVALGCDEGRARAALLSFPGVERRLQLVTARPDSPFPIPHSPFPIPHSPFPIPHSPFPILHSPLVYDDYAHNPEKLRAMLTTLQDGCEKGVCVVWRPHGYAPLRKMKDALADMFAATLRPQDALLLLPVYDAGGTTDRSINSDALAEALRARCATADVALVAGPDEAAAACVGRGGRCGRFVTCGARDPGLPRLARRIAHDLAGCAARP